LLQGDPAAEASPMSEPRLQRFLHEQGIGFETIHHARAGTAHATAHSAQLEDSDFAKTVMVKLDGRMAMVVLGADRRLDLAALGLATGCEDVELAPESEFTPLFPDCETGAMPPFGNLYGLDVFVEESLTEDEEIAFNAGSRAVSITMRGADFVRLAGARVCRFAQG